MHTPKVERALTEALDHHAEFHFVRGRMHAYEYVMWVLENKPRELERLVYQAYELAKKEAHALDNMH